MNSPTTNVRIHVFLNNGQSSGSLSLENNFDIHSADFQAMAEILREFQVVADKLRSRLGVPPHR